LGPRRVLRTKYRGDDGQMRGREGERERGRVRGHGGEVMRQEARRGGWREMG